jgi:MurNAc alpha-1-phosphate uridylyltransferase
VRKIQTIILALGEGVRLRPYTQLIPKPLMTINGIPLLTFHIDKLNSLGIPNEKIIVVVSHLKEEGLCFLNRFHKRVRVVAQGEKKGTAAAVSYAKNLIDDNEIVIVYIDIIF